jgi:hypothetical protein
VARGFEEACAPLRAVWSGAGTFEDRARALLWWLARRWGTVEFDGIALPAGVGPRTLAAACDVPQAAAAELLARSERLGIVRTRADGSLVLPLPGSGPARERRDELSARIAEQFAVSRLAAGDYREIIEHLDDQHRWSERRRTGGL